MNSKFLVKLFILFIIGFSPAPIFAQANVFINGQTGVDTADGTSPSKAVKTFDQAKSLLDPGGTIWVTNQINISGTQSWDLSGLGLGGDKGLIKRWDGVSVPFTLASDTTPYSGKIVLLETGSSLTLTNTIIDGNKDNFPGGTYQLIDMGTNSNVILGSGSVIRNNKSNYNGGCITQNLSGSILKMESGAEGYGCESKVSWGGFLIQRANTTFIATGGKLYDNKVLASNGSGGAIMQFPTDANVQTELSGDFEAYNNSCYGNGSFIHMGSATSNLTITDDVSIHDNIIVNTGYRGGAIFTYNATLKLSGSPLIVNNTFGSSGNRNVVPLKPIIINGNLDGGMVGVYPISIATIGLTDTLSSSDYTGYEHLVKDGAPSNVGVASSDNKIIFGSRIYNITFSAGVGGTVTGTPQTVSYGGSALAGATQSEISLEYDFIGWNYSYRANDGSIESGTVLDYTTVVIHGDVDFQATYAKKPFISAITTNGKVSVSKSGTIPTTTFDNWNIDVLVDPLPVTAIINYQPSAHYVLKKITFEDLYGQSYEMDLTKVSDFYEVGNDIPRKKVKITSDKATGKLTLEGVTTSLKFDITFEKEKYDITFDSKGGSLVPPLKVIYLDTVTEPSDPTRAGYIFDDWYTDESYTTTFDFTTLIDENKTIYAKWDLKTIVVTFDTDGGLALSAISYNVESPPVLPVPIREGYSFQGWYLGGIRVTSLVSVTDDGVLTARWLKNGENIINPNTNDLITNWVTMFSISVVSIIMIISIIKSNTIYKKD